MSNRIASACRSGLGQREKDEDDEERSHPGPVSAGCLKILLSRVSRQTRKRSWRARTVELQSRLIYRSSPFGSMQPARAGSDRDELGDIQWRRPAAAPVSVAQEHGDFVDELYSVAARSTAARRVLFTSRWSSCHRRPSLVSKASQLHLSIGRRPAVGRGSRH